MGSGTYKELETLERIYKRALHIETDIALLLTELESLKARLYRFNEMSIAGQELDFGFHKLFMPGPFTLSQPIQAYHTYADLLWFSYDTKKEFPPQLDVWHSQMPPKAGSDLLRYALNVALKNKNHHEWILMEVLLDWNILNAEQKISVALMARASFPVTVPVYLYADGMDGEGVRRGYTPLHISEDKQTIVVDMDLSDSFYNKANKEKPAKILFGLERCEGARIELMDLRIFVPHE